MNESEWLTSTDPAAMLEFLRGESRDRKLRLFGCACARHAWNSFVPPFTIRCVMAAEAFADSAIGATDLERVHQAVMRAFHTAVRDIARAQPPRDSGYLAYALKAAMCATSSHAQDDARRTARAAAMGAADAPVGGLVRRSHEIQTHLTLPEYTDELAAQAELARDIFGNPFRPVGLDPAWLTPDVLAMAKVMYASRDFSAMPILADALQDAGCDNDDVLIHCREDVEHARGCWVVDLLLGKE